MPEGIITIAYLAAGILFIFSLGGLSKQETASRGNVYGMIGMGIAILATILGGQVTGFGSYSWLILLMLLGGGTGVFVAKRVQMTSMPELVAILHSFVGAAAVLVGVVSYLEPGGLQGSDRVIHEIAIVIGVIVGTITFTGSVIAFGKLQGMITSKPLSLPFRHHLNLLMLIACFVLGGMILSGVPGGELEALLWIVFIASILGIHMILAIGGADMPVAIALLNSYSGLAAASTGFVLSNDILIITGSLVGASGIILTRIMCKAMNRSLVNVLVGAIGSTDTKTEDADAIYEGRVKRTSAEEVAILLDTAKRVVFVPGYGLAVSQAQHQLRDLATMLESRGVEVEYAIHPVAGRMPGHMNVLLAEADVDYDKLKEMDHINPTFGQTDVSIVIGANDIVNPEARTNPSSPIAGMPILDVDKSTSVIVIKRSLSPGFAGIPNPLFAGDNTLMLFGDGKQAVLDLLAAVKENE